LIREHWRILWGGLLGVALLFSLLFFILAPRALQSSILFFPTATDHAIESELRFLPKVDDPVARIRQLAQAALSGPLSLRLSRVAPPECRVLAVFMRDRAIYVDLSLEIQKDHASCPLAPLERLSMLAKMINFNESRMDRLIFLVQGKEVANQLTSSSRKS
jgi:hypothetical protein